jgi:hypothetical protein
MLAKNGGWLPQSWIAGDDEMGRPSWFRRRLAALGERYLLAVPSHTALRDLETAPPEYSGRGRPGKRPWHSVETWSPSLGEESWQRIDVRDGSKGPLVVEDVQRRVVSRTPRCQQGAEETLVVIRYRASKSVVSAAKAKPVWRTMRYVTGGVGSIIKRFRY